MTGTNLPANPTLHDLQLRVVAFIQARDWTQFHDDPKNTLLALMSEVGELAEHYRFTTVAEAQGRSAQRGEEIGDELADILYILLMFAHQNNIDLGEAFANKEAKRAAKYPIAQFKGINKKYNQG